MGLFTPLAIRIGGISWMPRFLPQIVWVDRLIQRLTRGRFTLLDLAGLPSAMLTVPGRKTGQPRSTPLLCIPYGSSYLIAGSYFGGPKEPMWVANLEAADSATLRFKGRTMPVHADPGRPGRAAGRLGPPAQDLAELREVRAADDPRDQALRADPEGLTARQQVATWSSTMPVACMRA